MIYNNLFTTANGKEHGNTRFTKAMKGCIARYVNQPHRTNISALTPSALFRRFVGDEKSPGKWYGKVGRSTFFATLNDKETFKTTLLATTPFVTEKHIAARQDFAVGYLTEYDTPAKLWALLKRVIFLDGTIFSDKFEEGYGLEGMRIVSTVENPRLRTKTQFPVLPRNLQLYQGIAWHDRTGPFIVNDHHPAEHGTPCSRIYRNFLRNHIVPLAARMRTKLGLPPTATIYLVYDHAACHRSKMAKDFMAEHHLESAELPARCPELNVIECLWALYKAEVRRSKKEDRLRTLVCRVVKRFSQDTITNLVRSFGGRLVKMMQAEGGKFKYGS